MRFSMKENQNYKLLCAQNSSGFVTRALPDVLRVPGPSCEKQGDEAMRELYTLGVCFFITKLL